MAERKRKSRSRKNSDEEDSSEVAEVTGTVQIVLMGLEYDRIWRLFKEFPPIRVYYVIEKSDEKIEKIMEKLDSLIPLVEKERIDVQKDDLFTTQTKLFRTVRREKEKGNRIIFNISAGSNALHMAAIHVSLMTNSQIAWGVPKYTGKRRKCEDGTEFDFELESYGVKDIRVMNAKDYFTYPLPSEVEADTLEIISKSKDVSGNLPSLVETVSKKVGKETLGSTEQARIVRMSNIISNLAEQGLIDVEGGGKKRKVNITNKGKYALELLK